MVGREIDAANMAWDRIRHFKDLQSIEKEYSAPDQIITVTKKLTIMKWIELLEEHVRKIRGVRKIPLSYLIRACHVATQVTPFPGGHTMPYGSEYESIHDEMIAYQGSNKWKTIVEIADKKLTTMKWNGRSHRYTLAMQIANARTYHIDLLRASQNITVDIPTETTRVTQLINSIETRDQFLISAIVEVKGDDGANDKANNFELAADYLLKMLPTMSRDNVSSYQISALEFEFERESDIPTRGPNTGVEVRYHSKAEYQELSVDEKEELVAIRTAARKINKDFGKAPPSNDNHN